MSGQKLGTNKANVQISREGLTFTDLPMKGTDIMKFIGLVL